MQINLIILYLQIYVNGKQFADFQARGKVEDIKSINVGGEAHIYEVKLLRRVVRTLKYTTYLSPNQGEL